jgi:bla regulator protein BlaR1
MPLLLALMMASGGNAWVLVHGHSSSMSGTTEDLRQARSYMAKLGDDFLWFRRDGKEYVVQDGKVIDSLKEALRPQIELGQEQTKLGMKQSELGQQQSELGQKQAEASTDPTAQAELGKAQRTLGEEQRKLGEEQRKLGEQQRVAAKESERQVARVMDESIKNGTARPLD